jgi:hypothetical protein
VTSPPPDWGDNDAQSLGNLIVFVRGDTLVHREMIYRVNVDGTGLTRLTSGPWDDHIAPSPNVISSCSAGGATSIVWICLTAPRHD